MIGVVVPAHEEEDHIGFCLQSVLRAARCPALDGEQVVVVVAVDRCRDATERIARQMGALCVRLDAGNVGAARAAGAQLALDIGVRWLAFTDADSVVAPDWLSAQLGLQQDACCGSVVTHDSGSYEECMQRHAESAASGGGQGDVPIHGANLGVSAEAYRRAGGFQALATSEDVALVCALERSGARIAWSTQPLVLTSARRSASPPPGFDRLAERATPATAPAVALTNSL